MAQTFVPEIWPITAGDSLHTVGLVTYTVGLLIAITARIQLGAYWSNVEEGYVFENHRLISRGLYSHIRHPIYTGDLLLLIGFQLALNSWLAIAVIGVMMFVLYRVQLEEEILTKNLPGYESYKAKTKRFVPFVY